MVDLLEWSQLVHASHHQIVCLSDSLWYADLSKINQVYVIMSEVEFSLPYV